MRPYPERSRVCGSKTRPTLKTAVGPIAELAHAAAESGRVLIGHLRAARSFLADGSAAGARNELIVAQDFSAALKHDMPFLEVSKSIRNAQQKLISGNTKIAYDDLLPTYGQFGRYASLCT